MKRFMILSIALLFLVSCHGERREVEKYRQTAQSELVTLINQCEQDKAQLKRDFDADSGNSLQKLDDPAAAVQKNIAKRAKALDDIETIIKKVQEGLTKYPDETMSSFLTSQTNYVKLSREGLELEKNFFKQMATGTFLLSDLKSQQGLIETNRQKQRDIFLTQTPSEATTEATAEATKESSKVTPRYRFDRESQHFIALGDAPEKALLLTFDDVPQAEGGDSLRIANTLKAHQAKAIFFVFGPHLETEAGKKVVKELYKMGFQLGNHTVNHPDLTKLSPEEIRKEIRDLSDKVEALVGERPKFFRPPYGSTNSTVEQIVKEEGMLQMNWTFGYDWEDDYQKATALADVMVNSPYLQNGANLLMHDRKNTADALDDILKGLSKKGYQFIDPLEIAHE